MIDLLSARLKEWWFDDNSQKLTAIVTGSKFLTRAAADACLKDPQLADAMTRQRAVEAALKMDVVPVFFVNGARYETELPLDAIEKLVAAAAPVQTPASNLPVYQLIGACDLVAAHNPGAAPSIRAADDQLAALALAICSSAAHIAAFSRLVPPSFGTSRTAARASKPSLRILMRSASSAAMFTTRRRRCAAS